MIDRVQDLVSKFVLTGVLAVGSVSAVPFSFMDDEVTGSLDVTATYGMGFRVEGRDPSNIGTGNGGTKLSTNEDDGNLNYNQWDPYTHSLKTTVELDARYKNWSVFSRADALYDFQVEHVNPRRTMHNKAAKGSLGHDMRLLDLYVQHDNNIGDVEFSVRVGNQVLNWGESTFIQGGLNVINPVEVARLRTAGSEIRDALLPIQMVRLDVSFNETLSAVGFWSWHWQETRLDPKGTFFSTSDFASPGGHYVMLTPAASDTGPFTGAAAFTRITRVADGDGNDFMNFGFALRYYAEELNDTEFGLYFAWYASRLPVVSGIEGPLVSPGAIAPAVTNIVSSNYFVEYPDDIMVVGASFNTMIKTIAIQGEYSFHYDQPLQISSPTLLSFVVSPVFPSPGGVAVPTYRSGYVRRNYSQAQVTATHNLGPILGSDQAILLYEVGATYIHNMPGSSSATPLIGLGSSPADDFAMGYVVRATADYANLIGAWTVTPTLSFRHDLFGRIPQPVATFLKDQMQFTAQLSGRYQNFEATVSYTNFFNGNNWNLLRDRDFVTISGSYAF